MVRKYKIKNAHIGNCAFCNKEIWRAEKGWIVQPRDAIYKEFLCHTIDPKTDCFAKYNVAPKATF